MNYNERLKELREERNLTQEQLANAINLTRGAYKQYELQYDIIPLVHLNSLSNFYNVSIDYILNLTNERKYANSSQNIDKEKLTARIKNIRLEIFTKQELFADMLNINQSMICEWETGKKMINTLNLYTICSKCHISADYLLGKTDDPKYLD